MTQFTQRGSLWRVWDFHMHTPASHQWRGAKLEDAANATERDAIIKTAVEAIRLAVPDVVVIMDYWTFDGYLAIKEYVQNNPDALGGKTVMPGIEIRVESSHPKQRLNLHFVLSPELEDRCLADLLAELKISLRSRERGVSNECFIEWARELGDDKLKKHSFDKSKVDSEDKYALDVGRKTAEVTSASAQAALQCLPNESGLMLMPWDTYGGMTGIDWANHYAEVRRWMQADIFECKDIASRECFHGKKTANNESFFDNFWSVIERQPRLCVRGTDAHAFSDYGKFPSDMKTWIKGEPTFLGLRQAIKEPSNRSYIGNIPPKLAMVEANGSLYLDRLEVTKKSGKLPDEDWFDGLNIEFNPDLVAIIGNKGSGKSGLVDVLALAGNSGAQNYFTFLNEERFKAGGLKRVQSFEFNLKWCNGDVSSNSLDSTAQAGTPERVKYISQMYFEDMCNEHVTGKSDRFAQEIKSVLFSKMDPAERLSYANLDAYLTAQESAANERLAQLRASLHDVNAAMVAVDQKATPEYQNTLKEKLASKQLALRDIEGQKPAEVQAPAIDSVPKAEQTRLAQVNQAVTDLGAKLLSNESNRKLSSERRQALIQAGERVSQFAATAKDTNKRIEDDLKKAGIDLENPIYVQTKLPEIEQLKNAENEKNAALAAELIEINESTFKLKSERETLQAALDGPARAYQVYLAALKDWEEKKALLIGTPDTADSLSYYVEQINNLSDLPARRSALSADRRNISTEIYDALKAIADSRKPLFKPVEQIVADFPAVQEDLKIDFQSRLFFDRRKFSEDFFRQVKQSTGGFRGEIEGQVKLDGLIRATDFESGAQVVDLLDSICTTLTNGGQSQLQPILRAGVTSQQFYDKVFGLENLEAKFSLSLAGTTMQQMSPGQRGALLLIFYLLVDSDQTPLILDQPEENLDNQTVYSMLVPVIQRAKQRRQIVLVTHNANLAVCCDAEQIIHATFNRSDRFKLRYICGPLELPSTNKSVVDVLEGTAPAFVNRKEKYIQ